MKFWEEMALRYTGALIVVMGFCGAVVTILFDDIAGRVGQEARFGPMQIAGIVVFLLTMFAGVFVTKFLGQVKELLERYLNK